MKRAKLGLLLLMMVAALCCLTACSTGTAQSETATETTMEATTQDADQADLTEAEDTAEEPVTEEPVAEEPTAEEPVTEEPVVVEPAPVATACQICQSQDYTTYDSGAALCDTCYAHLQAAAQSYMDYLEPARAYYDQYVLFDLNKDGIPELITEDGCYIYTYSTSAGRVWTPFESYVIVSLYGSTQNNQVLESYSFKDTSYYNLYELAVGGSFQLVSSGSNRENPTGYEDELNALVANMVLLEPTYDLVDVDTMLNDLMTCIAGG